MNGAKPPTKEEKRLAKLAVETEKQKKALVAQLQKTPIVQLACERTSVGRATYYQWRAKDLVFARAADRALEAGRFFINDLAESRLIRMAQDGNLTAIIFWLKHNHPKYAVTSRIIHEHEVVSDRLSIEEKSILAHEAAKRFAKKHEVVQTAEETKELIEEEFAAQERNEPYRKRMQEFETG